MAVPVVSYTTASLMLATLAETSSMETITLSVVALHAAAAQNEINASIAHMYSLPFTEEIPILTTLCTDMAIYRTLTGRIVITEDDTWFDRYSKDPPKLLKSIVAGETKLVTTSFDIVATRTDVTAGGAPYSNHMDHPPTHSELDWTQHVQDPDKIEDLADERDLDTVGDLLK